MNIAAISVGSNIEAPRYIALAKETLQKEQTFLKESAFVTTAPLGTSNQPDFSKRRVFNRHGIGPGNLSRLFEKT
jgi:7,8-dihydro-6-hydroxymethylpterin-pyrophosphokinase